MYVYCTIDILPGFQWDGVLWLPERELIVAGEERDVWGSGLECGESVCPGEVVGCEFECGESAQKKWEGLDSSGEKWGSLDSSAREKLEGLLLDVERKKRVGSIELRPIFTRVYCVWEGSIYTLKQSNLEPQQCLLHCQYIIILVHLQISELIVTALHHWFIIVQFFIIGEHIFQHLQSEMQPLSHAWIYF